MNALICRNEKRREAVRQRKDLNGLDYLEIGDGGDRNKLTVYFLGKAPVSLGTSNIIIEGGRRIRDIEIEKVRVIHTRISELDDFMEVFTDKEGDFSIYTLRVVDGRDEQGNWKTHPAFDPRYDRVAFTFKSDCPSDLDCKQEAYCPPETLEEPEINYLAKDYTSFRQLILDRLALVMPGWWERHVPDLGLTLVELLAYTADYLSYYQDAMATEAYLDTARQRISVRRHARLVDYSMHEGCNARTWVCVETDGDLTVDDPSDLYFITNVDGLSRVLTEEELMQQPTGGYEVFKPITESIIHLYAGQYNILFYTWGDSECCLPRGTTAATLRGKLIEKAPPADPSPCDPEQVADDLADKTEIEPSVTATGPVLHLDVGDILIFEEVIGPKTGRSADADPKHRYAVRLIDVRAGFDPLQPEIAITEITWAEEDALPFPLCLSAQGPPPCCKVIENISIARGNVILVDHGKIIEEDLEPVPVKMIIEACDCLGGVAEAKVIADRYEPALKKTPLTFRQPVLTNLPASRMLTQDARLALPQVTRLASIAPNGKVSEWRVQCDLFESECKDPHFVVEMDNDGHGRLRFGDDTLGQRPVAGSKFHVAYRMGNGPAGNVGAGTIRHLVTRKTRLSSGITKISNPLPAAGGALPEPLAEVKLMAPHAFRKRMERAITPKDYADIVLREFPEKVQRAAAQLLWNGSWYEMQVVIDPLGREEADTELLEEIENRLYRYRRIGHDLVVKAADRVPLEIELVICVQPSHLKGHVKAALLDLFSNRSLPDGRRGFFHPDNLTFGEGIYLSKLVATAQAVSGVESVHVKNFNRLFEPPNGEIENGILPLGPFEIARLDNDPNFREKGRLTLVLGGGR